MSTKKTDYHVVGGTWTDINVELTDHKDLIRLLNRRLRSLLISICDDCGGPNNTIFNGIPDLAWDYDAQAMLDAGHIDGESLVRVDDQTGYDHHAYPVGATFIVLEANQFGNYAGFNFEGNKGAVTATEFITPTANPGCTVFAVVKRTGTHQEHGLWWGFSSVASPSAIPFSVAESHHFGAAFDEDDKFELGGLTAYVNALDTDVVVIATRFNDSTSGEIFINGARADLLTQAGVFSGTSFNPPVALDSPCTFHLGNGIIGGGNGQEGKSPRTFGFGRALSNAEILSVSDELMALYGSQISSSLSNGQQLRLRSLTELTTIAAAATTDTALLVPAYAVVAAVDVRVTVAIPTAVTFTVGDSGSAARHNNVAVPVAVGSTDKGTKGYGYVPTANQAIRITPSAVPATNAGRVRVTVFYWESIPASS